MFRQNVIMLFVSVVSKIYSRFIFRRAFGTPCIIYEIISSISGAVAVHIEKVLTSPIVKRIYLATDANQYGVFDTSDRYLLIAEDGKLKLFNLNGEQVGALIYVHTNRAAGYVQRIVCCKSSQQFFILCQHCLFVLIPAERRDCGQIKLIPHIKPIGNDKL
jgi:hypothetical protein